MQSDGRIRWLLVLGCTLVVASYSTASEQWTATTDFSATQNPNGQWSYGWSDNPGISFQLYETVEPWAACSPHGVTQWFEPIAADPAPHVSRSDSCAIFNCGGAGGVDFLPGDLVVHPGPGGEHSVIRWTAPASAEFAIAASFQGRDQDGASTDVHVFHNSAELFSAAVTGTGLPQTYVQLEVALAAGDTIDFTVGDGGNGNLNDTTAVYASVVRTSWNAGKDFSPTTNPNGNWSYKWSGLDLYTETDTWSVCLPNTVQRWFEPRTVELTPSVSRNSGENAINCGGIHGIDLQPGELVLHPGNSQTQSIIQWDSSFAGIYSVLATFEGRDRDGVSTQVEIEHSTSDFTQVLFTASVSGTNNPVQFSHPSVGVDSYGSIQFGVGPGTNGHQNDATAIDVQIKVSGGSNCGDGECGGWETWYSCQQDCSFPPKPRGLDPEDIFFPMILTPRFVSIPLVDAASDCMALRVKLDRLHHVNPPYSGGPTVPFTEFEDEYRWVGPPQVYVESSSNGLEFFAASLQCEPYFHDWSSMDVLYVTGSAVTPSSRYEAATVASSCAGSESGCSAVSTHLLLTTSRWGDVAWPYNPPDVSVQPDVTDISALVNKFRNALGAPTKVSALLAGEPGNPFGEITPFVLGVDFGFSHISACVDAYRGREYPYTIEPCP